MGKYTRFLPISHAPYGMTYINHSEQFDACSSGRGEWDDEARAKYPISMLAVIKGRSIMLPFFKPS
jgi:hypothetical protein